MSKVSVPYSIPPPDDQLAFLELLVAAKGQVMQEALLEIVGSCDLAVIDDEAHRYAPPDALSILAGKGLRAELAFALPTILTKRPYLLGYYRLLLGFSQKAFYTKSFGLSGRVHMAMEQEGALLPGMTDRLPELCLAINDSAAHLVRTIRLDRLTRDNLRDLTVLTFGPQLRGGRNVNIGADAVARVFAVIGDIVGAFVESRDARAIRIRDSTGRIIAIRLSADPDVEIVTQTQLDEVPVLAIEIKGGRDFSNVHNRLGEAEKSHIKAKRRGFTDLWTITNVTGLSHHDRTTESPTTTRFFDLEDVVARKSQEYSGFRESLCQKLRLPSHEQEP